MFTLDDTVNMDCTSCCGKLLASYNELVAIFGIPNSSGDDYKVSTEWLFINDNDCYGIAVYDWKETSLYDPDLPSVEAFRRDSTSKQEWSIGAHNDVQSARFHAWYASKIKALREQM